MTKFQIEQVLLDLQTFEDDLKAFKNRFLDGTYPCYEAIQTQVKQLLKDFSVKMKLEFDQSELSSLKTDVKLDVPKIKTEFENRMGIPTMKLRPNPTLSMELSDLYDTMPD